MKTIKQILRWMLFLVVFLAFHFYAGQVNASISPDKVKRVGNLRYFLDQGSYDVVFFGNSHMFYGINPSVVNDLLPETATVALPHYPSSLTESYAFVHHLVSSNQPPKVVVLDVFVFTQQTGSLYWAVAPLENASILPSMLKNVPADDHMAWVFPFLNSHTIWKDADKVQGYWKAFRVPAAEAEQLDASMHLIGKNYINNTVMGLEKYDQAFQAGYYRLNQRQYWELQAFVELCEKNDVALFLVNLPAVNQWGLPYPEVVETLQDFDLAYVDYNLEIPQDKHYGRVIFLDTDQPQVTFNSHMNSMGAVLASLYVAEDLADLYGFPFDETIKEQYQEVLLTDVLVHGLQEDGSSADGEEVLIFEAVALVAESPTEFRWQLFNGKELVDQQAFSTVQSYSLPVEYWGKDGYRIVLTIKHPVLTGKDLSLSFDLGEKQE